MDPQPQPSEPRSDSALITAFCEARDDATRQTAFAGLVRQHGAMVLATCRRITGNATDAEDAAQAVFLTLASKAKTLRRHPTLGGWLHRVARNIALRQREAVRVRTRYEAHEEARAMTSPPDGLDDRLRGELREVLDSALDNLAERYRAPLVLHYLEGHSQEEVARILHLNAGTLASLLSRGRDLLRNQLSRKGVAVGAVALTAMLAGEAQAAVLPAAFAATTTKAASAVMAGSFSAAAASGATTPHVIALSKGALTSMAIIKLTGAAAIAAATLTVGAFTATTLMGGAAEPAPAVVAATAPIAPSDPQNLDQTGPEVAVMSAIRALRTNDAVAFLRRLPPTMQAESAHGWKNLAVLGNPWITGMLDGGLNALAAADAVPQLTATVSPLLAQIPAQELAQHVLDFSAGAAEGGPGQGLGRGRAGLPSFLMQNLVAGTMQGLISGMLASGLEGQQTLAVQALLADLAAWLPTAGLDDQAKTGKAVEAVVAAARAIAITTTGDLTGLSLPDLLVRIGKAMPALKQMLAVYDLQLDQVLDSVKVSEVKSVDGRPDQRLLTLDFTAFGKPHALPLKMVLKDGSWSVANDSPLAAWLRPRLPGLGLFGGGGFGGGRGNWGGQGGGPGGQGGPGGGGQRGPRGQRGTDGQPGQDAPPPTANPGF